LDQQAARVDSRGKHRVKKPRVANGLRVRGGFDAS
jgi:hypothetical protein